MTDHEDRSSPLNIAASRHLRLTHALLQTCLTCQGLRQISTTLIASAGLIIILSDVAKGYLGTCCIFLSSGHLRGDLCCLGGQFQNTTGALPASAVCVFTTSTRTILLRLSIRLANLVYPLFDKQPTGESKRTHVGV
ncbi:uncharacterized protein FOMMEDRAFT_16580 [Fomitiporia mediterranea MF3/22]|uniref:uncharacterized protein n=1 Tax=Fomitiporia mediterranea (strain MF3/22) TaxID=694068 RepID=UPI000440948B|nr:uncharacterized protein FOMMEDRAFT_16580 [Fomitiporia mediterranea MF3/22]EJD08079.1 hypothetical protein FOMMEDRAFT_16580 [Fomitiporia mediterranea MF3/22]